MHLPYDIHPLTRTCLYLNFGFMVAEFGVQVANFLENGILAQTVEVEGSLVEQLGALDDSLSEISFVQSVVAMTGLIYTVILLFALVFNAIWFYRASANAAAIDPNPDRISPGWTVGWFAIPIASFWMPFRAAKQIWLTSVERNPDLTAQVPGWVLVWWMAWLAVNITAQFTAQSYLGAETTADLIDANTLGIWTAPFSIASAYLLIRYQTSVAAAQTTNM